MRSMTVDRGVLALIEAKPGQGQALADLLEQARELAAAEPGTVSWYAFRLSDTTYGIFDTFENEDARQAHINGRIPAALSQRAEELLARAPDIQLVEVLAVR
jgi:quinol monooxygenase YgiN